MSDFCCGRRIGGVIGALILLLSVAVPAHAGMVGTDRVLHDADSAAQREALVELLERDAVAMELEALGVSGDDARERVERLTDTEVAHLHEQVASLPAPAGGNLSVVQLLLIILLIVLLV